MRRFWFVLFLIGSQALADNQNWETNGPQVLGTKFGISNASLAISVQGKNPGTTKIQYVPKVPSKGFVSLSYASFTISAGLGGSLTPDENRIYGNSSSTDLQFHFFLTRFTFDFFYQEYSGYYIQNTADIDPNLAAQGLKIQRPDLSSKAYGFDSYYFFNHDFYSQGAAFEHSRRQMTSGGSAYALVGLQQAKIDGGAPLIPSQVGNQYGLSSQFSSGEFNTLKFGAGYGYNFIYANYYIAGLLGLSYGEHQQRYALTQQNLNRWAPQTGSNLKLGLGYNGEKYYGGVQLFANTTSLDVEDMSISLATIEESIFIGARFGDLPIPWLDRLDQTLFGRESSEP